MASALYLLDTNIVVHVVRADSIGKYVDETYGLRKSPYKPLISIVSRGELYVLADRGRWGADKMQALRNAIDNCVPVDISDEEIIQAYVAIHRHYRTCKPAANMDENDYWIAATALVTDAILLTTDQDFQALPLSLVRWEYIDPRRASRSGRQR